MRIPKVLLADDEQDALEALSSMISDIGNCEIVASVSDPKKIECKINKYRPDVLFLDIKMPHLNGLELTENLRQYNHDLKIVFVTAFTQYMSEAIKFNAYSYLHKPVDLAELEDLLQRIRQSMNASADKIPKKKLRLPVKNGVIFVKTEELLKMEADGNYTHITTTNDECYLSSYNMGRLFEILPFEVFFRISRNCVINSEFLVRINRKELLCHLRYGNKKIELPVSKSFLRNFNNSLK